MLKDFFPSKPLVPFAVFFGEGNQINIRGFAGFPLQRLPIMGMRAVVQGMFFEKPYHSDRKKQIKLTDQ